MSSIRISAPDTAKPGEIIEIKTLIQHPMESGFRRDSRGEVVPRDIIVLFTCDYNDETIFKADFFPAIAANPFLSFFTRATESGTLTFSWVNEAGETWTETHDLTVSEG